MYQTTTTTINATLSFGFNRETPKGGYVRRAGAKDWNPLPWSKVMKNGRHMKREIVGGVKPKVGDEIRSIAPDGALVQGYVSEILVDHDIMMFVSLEKHSIVFDPSTPSDSDWVMVETPAITAEVEKKHLS